MELALNCMFLQGQETPPSQSSIGYEGSMTQVLCSLPAPTLNRCCQRSQYKFKTNS